MLGGGAREQSEREVVNLCHWDDVRSVRVEGSEATMELRRRGVLGNGGPRKQGKKLLEGGGTRKTGSGDTRVSCSETLARLSFLGGGVHYPRLYVSAWF